MAGVMLIALWFSATRGDDFSERDRLFAQLSLPMTSIVDGKPFRDALAGIAKQANVNLWLDRSVDPTTPVEAGPLGPTVFAALQKLAARRHCVVMPVANVLLVGSAKWVDETTASILSLELSKTPSPADADISWDDLASPSEALQRAVAGDAGVDVEPSLPHDLWPSARWTQMDRRVAVTLVLAQFDRRPQSTASLHNLKGVAASSAGKFTRRYSPGKANAEVRRVMIEVDRGCRFRSSNDWLEATGSVSAHRAAVAAIFQSLAVAAAPDPIKDTFTLKRMSAPAEHALHQLAQSARKTCVIDASAREACMRIVSIEGEDVTLKQLIDLVAAQVGVVAKWQGDTILISREQ